MTEDENKSQEIQYHVDKSIRYHNLRKRFFTSWDNGIEMFTVTVLAITIGFVPSDHMGWIGVGAVMVWVVGKHLDLAGKARLHDNLSHEFSYIQMRITIDGNPSKFADHIHRATMIEPPIKKYLDLICHNQVAISIGSDDVVKLTWWQRRFAQYLNGNSAIQ